jgi:hypothetical protein
MRLLVGQVDLLFGVEPETRSHIIQDHMWAFMVVVVEEEIPSGPVWGQEQVLVVMEFVLSRSLHDESTYR